MKIFLIFCITLLGGAGQALASGHGGGTTITTRIDQNAREAAFLMHFLGMEAPQGDK